MHKQMREQTSFVLNGAEKVFVSRIIIIIIFFFDLILYVHSTIFQLCGTGLPGLNQY